jgi:hypothetical protein
MANTITRHPMKKSFGPSLSISFAMGISPTDIQQVNCQPDQFVPTNPNLPAGVRASSPSGRLSRSTSTARVGVAHPGDLWLTQIPRLIHTLFGPITKARPRPEVHAAPAFAILIALRRSGSSPWAASANPVSFPGNGLGYWCAANLSV